MTVKMTKLRGTRPMTSKNSENSPLHIAEVRLDQGGGSLGLTLCPGKKDAGRNWNRDLRKDLQAIRSWGATTVVTLIEDHEFRLLGIESLADDVRALGMNWVYLPIVDVSIPDGRFEDSWVNDGPKLHDRLDAGEKILIHCRGGLGRTGLVAGRILVERGSAPGTAIGRVRSVRPHAIETAEQENYVLKSKFTRAKMAENYKQTMPSESLSPVLVNGPDALTVAGMERIWVALTGKQFTPEERNACQEKIDASIIDVTRINIGEQSKELDEQSLNERYWH